MVPIPDEADEDERRCVREREDLVSERVSLVNRVVAMLTTLGCATTTPCAGIGVSAWTRYARRSEIRFRRTQEPEYFACSIAWSWCAPREVKQVIEQRGLRRIGILGTRTVMES
jgi:hypothetical protein